MVVVGQALMMAFLPAAISLRGNVSMPQYPTKLILVRMNTLVGNEMLVFDAV
ncbi:hypothetical protein B398_03145 [Xylella fastidiosa 32]|uniref:Uncharacterized protein n=1 Tax=Xylella fastidiosa (strain 9a5c) TaxID=160492 RepID=Q9PAV4_XYLFA|nr:hypothetical protein XF_2391 [Xylella fastidiosa 9a5c]ETE34153.1 hypothetical protein B398_03145 [Xylella fastidiosa 32]